MKQETIIQNIPSTKGKTWKWFNIILFVAMLIGFGINYNTLNAMKVHHQEQIASLKAIHQTKIEELQEFNKYQFFDIQEKFKLMEQEIVLVQERSKVESLEMLYDYNSRVLPTICMKNDALQSNTNLFVLLSIGFLLILC